VLVGEGGRLAVDVSPVLIHPQLTVLGSWVTSRWRMAEPAENLARWELHPQVTVTCAHPLEEVAAAYGGADAGQGGKIAIVPSPENSSQTNE
jgi:threonine dehydrogenase-like Zn-dependent dehydrogenase